MNCINKYNLLSLDLSFKNNCNIKPKMFRVSKQLFLLQSVSYSEFGSWLIKVFSFGFCTLT